MNICLIRPPQLITQGSIGNKAAVPLGIAQLAAVLQQQGHRVTLIDAIAEAPEAIAPFTLADVFINGLQAAEIISRIPADIDVIGFSLMFTMNWLHDRQLIQQTRQHFPVSKIIAGGEHITALPQLSLKQVPALDAVVLGEGETTLVELLTAFENNTPLAEISGIAFLQNQQYIQTPPRKRQTDLENLPLPAWQLLPVQQYFDHSMVFGVDRGKCLPLMASRGCPYRCTFCSSPDMWGTRYVLRPVQQVANEIEYLHRHYGVQNVDFYDLTAIVKRDWIVALCQEIIARQLNITWQLPSGTRSEAIDEEVAKLLYQSGCRNVTYAPESGAEDLLKIILKKVTLNNLLLSAKYSVKHGLNVKVNIIVALPDERYRHVLKTLWLLVRCSWVGVHDTTPGLFYPYPGSKIFNGLVETGEIDLATDTYFERLIFTDSLTRNYAYNKHMSIGFIRFYQFLVLAVFYGSNYLFRPWRLVKTLRNIFTHRYESRFEMTFADMLKPNKLNKVPRKAA